MEGRARSCKLENERNKFPFKFSLPVTNKIGERKKIHVRPDSDAFLCFSQNTLPPSIMSASTTKGDASRQSVDAVKRSSNATRAR
jgi:hypothetical protein